MKKKKRPKCIVCEEKPARIGKAFGYSADIICSQKCAVDEFMIRCMDIELCEICGEWTEVCGNCEVEE